MNSTVASTTHTSVGIIGAGSVGSVLAEKLASVNRLAWIVSRSGNSSVATHTISTIKDAPSAPEFVFLCVPDGAIFDVALELSNLVDNWQIKPIICHCSGVKGLDVLSPLAGITETAKCHPFQTFAVHKPALLNGIAWGVVADSDSTYYSVAALVASLSGIPVKLPDSTELHAYYHASAVAASNFVSGAIQLAIQFAQKASINATEVLPQIINTTIANAMEAMAIGAPVPVSGIVARGDSVTLQQQLQSFNSDPTLQALYRSYSLLLAQVLAEYHNDSTISSNAKTVLQMLTQHE